MKERTAAYIRVSTMEQKLHGLSLDAQRDTLKRYAESHDLEIVAWYEDEGISGRKEVRKRPALQRMMKDVEKEMFIRILKKYDGNITRAARELGMARTTVYRKIRKYGLEV